MANPELILHIGANKCGSSALQTALTQQPELVAHDGQHYSYVASEPGRVGLLRGAELSAAGRAGKVGYCNFSWQPATCEGLQPALAQALPEVLAEARRSAAIPILSNEAIYPCPGAVAPVLAGLGHPRVDIVVFLRPPLLWLNAAFWQWGVWNTPDPGQWLSLKEGRPYVRVHDRLREWLHIPNVRLHVRPMKPDVLGHFAALYGLTLRRGIQSNASSPRPLLGFLLRNRRFRPHEHASDTEFVFLRWCPPLRGQGPWAFNEACARQVRPMAARLIRGLRETLPADDCEALFSQGESWAEDACDSRIKAGPTPLHDPAGLPLLYESLKTGIARAAAEAGQPVPPVPPLPAAPAGDFSAADRVLAEGLDRLLALDRLVHIAPPRPPQRRRPLRWLASRLGRG